MSITILLISQNNEFFSEMEQHYQNHLISGFFKIFRPQDMEMENHYDIIIVEEAYISMITIKNIPVIVIKKEDSILENSQYTNFYFINSPVDWPHLYDRIMSLQYVHNNTDLTLIHQPKIAAITTGNNTTNGMKVIKDDDITSFTQNQLSTKIYNKEDMGKINKILHSYGEENHLDKKVIAQASIILDELLFLINKLQDDSMNMQHNNPVILLQMESKEGDFTMNMECKVKIPQFSSIVSMAQDYGNTVRSFERNNSSIVNIQWHL